MLHVFPATSTKLNVKLPLPVNKYIPDHQLLVIVIPVLLNPVSVATTFQLVQLHDAGAYATVAIGCILSIHVTVAVALPVFPAISVNVKVNVPLPVKRYIPDHQLFVIVIASEIHVSVATTFPVVDDDGVYTIVAVGAI